jgi:hypothetical protein
MLPVKKVFALEDVYVSSASQRLYPRVCTVRKMDLILRSIQRRPQMQFSMARKFTLQDYADMT